MSLEFKTKTISKEREIEYTPEKMMELSIKIINEAEKIEIKEKDRNEKGELLVIPSGPVSSLGKQSELWWKMVRTESFKGFFGNWQNNKGSNIVDLNGEPLALFRGVYKSEGNEDKDLSFSDFYNDDYYEKKVRILKGQDPGVFFSPLPELAFGWKGQKGNVIPAFVNARKTKDSESFLARLHTDIRRILLRFPKGILKVIPKKLLSDFDSVFYNGRNINEADEISVRSSYQVLIIPNAIEKYQYKRFDNNTGLLPKDK